MPDELKDHQKENVEWIQRVRRGLLADEPGLGKSRSAIEGFKGAESVLIVAPPLILNTGVWNDEVERWGFDDTKYWVAPYSQLNRVKPTAKGGRRPIKVLDDRWKRHWDAIIVDEAHYIKGRDSMRTWAVQDLSKRCDSIVLMTGTPIPNWAHEVFSLLRAINPAEAKRGEELGSFWRWARQYFDTSPSVHSDHGLNVGRMAACTRACATRNADDPCEHYVRFARENFGERYMRHLRDDCLDLPALAFDDVPTQFSRQTASDYKTLRDNFAATIEGNQVLTWSQGAKNVALDKMTTSPWLLHKEGEPRGGKFDQLYDDLTGRSAPTLVLAHYRDTVEACNRVAQRAGARTAFIHGGTTDKQNADAVRRFKAGTLDVLVGSLETLAEGLTLTVADTAIFVERSFKPSRNTQATYRIHRMGQDKECFIRRYITPNSVDSRKEKLLNTKTDHQMRTLTAAEFVKMA